MTSELHKQDKDELKSLRKKVADLEQDNRVLKELLDLLKDMPAQAAAQTAPKGKKISPFKDPNPLRQDRALAQEPKQKQG